MSAKTFDPLTCDLCGSPRCEVVLERNGRSFTSDSRVVPVPLRKLACLDCGLIRNGVALSEEFLDEHYGADYALGRDATRAEPLYFTAAGEVPRSQMIHSWIEQSLAAIGVRLDALREVLEVGCGEGSLLKRFAASPGTRAHGVEMNQASVAAARAAGLDVAAGGYADVNGQFDLIYAFAVIEHVPSPADFIGRLREHLTPRGLLVIAQPCQDRGNVDLFFCDHLHHFHSRHINAYAKRHGMNELYATNHHEHIRDFSLHVLGSGEGRGGRRDVESFASDVAGHVRRWQAVFAGIDGWLAKQTRMRLVVWGLGQTYLLLRAYTSLGEAPVSLGIDDNTRRVDAAALGFPVIASREMTQHLTERDAVFFTFPPREAQRASLEERRIPYYSFSL